MINGYHYEEYNYFYIRSGLSIYEVKYEDGILYELFRYTIIDEVINTFQTTEMMMSLEEIKDIAKDGPINDFLQKIDFDKLNEINGYELFCSLLIDLWNNPVFKDSIEDEIIVGDLGSSIDNFNSYTFENAFDTLDDLLDEISDISPTKNYNNLRKPINKVKKIIKTYNKATKGIVKNK